MIRLLSGNMTSRKRSRPLDTITLVHIARHQKSLISTVSVIRTYEPIRLSGFSLIHELCRYIRFVECMRGGVLRGRRIKGACCFAKLGSGHCIVQIYQFIQHFQGERLHCNAIQQSRMNALHGRMLPGDLAFHCSSMICRVVDLLRILVDVEHMPCLFHVSVFIRYITDTIGFTDM